MIDFLKFPQEEIDQVIVDVAAERKIQEHIVEKDLYVSYVLDFLFTRSHLKDSLLFKGGTSLSKGYGLINRFSEDIDVVFNAERLPYDLQEVFNAGGSNGRKAKIEELDKKSIEFYETVLLPEIRDGLEAEVPGKFTTTRDGENIIIKYPASYSKPGDYVGPIVKIEMGTKDAWSETTKKILSCFIAEQYPANFKNEGKFGVNIASAERTFWEKILILHQESHRDSSKADMPARYSRHYYDIYKMYHTGVKGNAIADMALLEDVRKFTSTFYGRAWAQIDLARPGTFSLMPHPDTMNRLKDDYTAMHSMIYDSHPSIDEILECIKDLEDELNGYL